MGTGAGTGSVVTPSSFAVSLLKALGCPITNQNVADIVKWESAEGGNWGNTAHYNPLDTTQNEPGATSMNSVGVKAYTSWGQGLAATITTLNNGHYGKILAALKSGSPNLGQAVGSTPWGTGNFGTVNVVNPKGTYHLGDILITKPGDTSGVGLTQSKTPKIPNPLKGIDAIGATFVWLAQPKNWIRVLEVVSGGLLLGFGVYKLAHSAGINVPKPSQVVGAIGAATATATGSPELAAPIMQASKGIGTTEIKLVPKQSINNGLKIQQGAS